MTSDPGSARHIRVVYLDHVARLSGAEIALLRLVPALEAVDARVVLAEDGPLVGRLRAAGVGTEVFPMAEPARDLRRGLVHASRLPVRSVLASVAYTLRLALRLRQLRPDVVHTNSLKACYYGSVAGRLAGVAVVWHARDRIAEDYLPGPGVRLTRLVAGWLPAAVIANSMATMATLPPSRYRHRIDAVVPDAYRPTRTPSRREKKAGEPLVVGMVGRISAWKGQHVAIEAFASAFRGSDHRLILAGEALFGEEKYEQRLRQDIEQLGMASQIQLLGHVADVEEFLAGIDVLVHASTIPEPFGQVIVEGMAAGVPVVATAAGGPAEIITPDQDGLLVPPGDVGALRDALLRLAGDADLRLRLSEGGRKSALRYEPQDVEPEVMRVYDTVLARAGRERSARKPSSHRHRPPRAPR